jgi:hypothetical protein
MVSLTGSPTSWASPPQTLAVIDLHEGNDSHGRYRHLDAPRYI